MGGEHTRLGGALLWEETNKGDQTRAHAMAPPCRPVLLFAVYPAHRRSLPTTTEKAGSVPASFTRADGGIRTHMGPGLAPVIQCDHAPLDRAGQGFLEHGGLDE